MLARRQRLAVLVELIVGQADEDAPVAVGERLPVGPRLLGEDVGRPVVGEIDQRVAGRLGRLGVDPALFTWRAGCPAGRASCPAARRGGPPPPAPARRAGDRAGLQGLGLGDRTARPCGRAAPLPLGAGAPPRRSPPALRGGRTFAVQTGRFAAAAAPRRGPPSRARRTCPSSADASYRTVTIPIDPRR